MKGRNTLAGLSLLALVGCGQMPEGRSWRGDLSSVPGYTIDVNQRRQGSQITSNEIKIIGVYDDGFGVTGNHLLIRGEDNNGDGSFSNSVDRITVYGMQGAEADLAIQYAHPVKLAQVLQEALPNAINNPAYKK